MKNRQAMELDQAGILDCLDRTSAPGLEGNAKKEGQAVAHERITRSKQKST